MLQMPDPQVYVRPALRSLADRVEELPLALIVAPAGSGKTTLLSAWRDTLRERGRRTARLGLASWHSDMATFLEDLGSELARDLEAEGERGPLFGEALLRRLPHVGRPEPERLARLFALELSELGEPLHLFLDDYHRLPSDCSVNRLLSELLRSRPPNLRLCIATRGARPVAAARLLVEEQALEVGPDDLSLRAEQVARLLRDRSLAVDEETRLLLLAQTRGWATGVLLGARVLAARPTEDARSFLGRLGDHEDLFDYVAGELIESEPEALLALLEIAAVMGPVPRRLLEEAAAGPDVAALDGGCPSRRRGEARGTGAGARRRPADRPR